MAKAELARWNRIRTELAHAVSIDEVKSVRDKAEALRLYAKQAGETLEVQNDVAEIKIRAERRAGELLKQDPDLKPGNPQWSQRATNVLSEADITKSQSSRWQQVAAMPEKKFEKHIEEVKESGEELTTAGVLREVRQGLRAKERERAITIPPPRGRYRTIVIDPPWPIQKIDREVRPNQAELGYPAMSIDEIAKLKPPRDSVCHLYLWTTQRFLPESFDIVEGWGFKHLVTLVWHKSGGFQPVGLPQYNCEFVLLARRGGLDFLDTKDFGCCFKGKRREHSRKPVEFYDVVRRVSPKPRINMFCRESVDGFDGWGNEPEKFDV